MSKLKVYSSKKIELSKKEKEILDKKLEREAEKVERDSKCGGIDGYGYIALHYR